MRKSINLHNELFDNGTLKVEFGSPKDGDKGDKGDPGFSPKATAFRNQDDTGAIIRITDEDGVHETYINDGANLSAMPVLTYTDDVNGNAYAIYDVMIPAGSAGQHLTTAFILQVVATILDNNSYSDEPIVAQAYYMVSVSSDTRTYMSYLFGDFEPEIARIETYRNEEYSSDFVRIVFRNVIINESIYEIFKSVGKIETSDTYEDFLIGKANEIRNRNESKVYFYARLIHNAGDNYIVNEGDEEEFLQQFSIVSYEGYDDLQSNAGDYTIEHVTKKRDKVFAKKAGDTLRFRKLDVDSSGLGVDLAISADSIRANRFFPNDEDDELSKYHRIDLDPTDEDGNTDIKSGVIKLGNGDVSFDSDNNLITDTLNLITIDATEGYFLNSLDIQNDGAEFKYDGRSAIKAEIDEGAPFFRLSDQDGTAINLKADNSGNGSIDIYNGQINIKDGNRDKRIEMSGRDSKTRIYLNDSTTSKAVSITANNDGKGKTEILNSQIILKDANGEKEVELNSKTNNKGVLKMSDIKVIESTASDSNFNGNPNYVIYNPLSSAYSTPTELAKWNEYTTVYDLEHSKTVVEFRSLDAAGYYVFEHIVPIGYTVIDDTHGNVYTDDSFCDRSTRIFDCGSTGVEMGRFAYYTNMPAEAVGANMPAIMIDPYIKLYNNLGDIVLNSYRTLYTYGNGWEVNEIEGNCETLLCNSGYADIIRASVTFGDLRGGYSNHGDAGEVSYNGPMGNGVLIARYDDDLYEDGRDIELNNQDNYTILRSYYDRNDNNVIRLDIGEDADASNQYVTIRSGSLRLLNKGYDEGIYIKAEDAQDPDQPYSMIDLKTGSDGAEFGVMHPSSPLGAKDFSGILVNKGGGSPYVIKNHTFYSGILLQTTGQYNDVTGATGLYIPTYDPSRDWSDLYWGISDVFRPVFCTRIASENNDEPRINPLAFREDTFLNLGEYAKEYGITVKFVLTDGVGGDVQISIPSANQYGKPTDLNPGNDSTGNASIRYYLVDNTSGASNSNVVFTAVNSSAYIYAGGTRTIGSYTDTLQAGSYAIYTVMKNWGYGMPNNIDAIFITKSV